MMTASEAVNEIRKKLSEISIPSALLDAELIVASALSITRTKLLAYPDTVLDRVTEEKISAMAKKRLRRMPMQYITGSCEFMGLDFAVNEHTLIPRRDTETVTEKAIEIIKKKSYRTVLDIGTGSGAIAVSIAKYTDTEVTASDISGEALETARINAKNNDTDVKFIKSDLFSDIDGKFDIIISNPPYIERNVIDTLDDEVRLYEPLSALDGGEDGLDFYRKITEKAKEHLNDSGALVYEIGYNQGTAVSKILKENNFNEISVNNDLSGLDRVVIGFVL